MPAPPTSSSGSSWYPVGSAADLIRDELDRGDTDFALRILAACLDEVADLADDGDRVAHLAEPPSTGDRRWDVLMAAAVRWRCAQLGVEPPGWTDVAPLDEDWWPVHDALLEARTRERTPPDLADRRIWLDARALTIL